jgi:hypothetical protein
VPFLALSRRQNAPADHLDLTEVQAAPQPAQVPTEAQAEVQSAH